MHPFIHSCMHSTRSYTAPAQCQALVGMRGSLMNKAQSLPSRSLWFSGATLTLPFTELRSAAAQLLAESDSNLSPFPPAPVERGRPVRVWSLSGTCPKDVVCLQDTHRPPSHFCSHQEEALFFLQSCPLPRAFFFFSD